VDAELVAIALCLIGSAFFSSSETALTGLPITRLEALRARTGPLTKAGLERWSNAPQQLLITILVGNNLVNVLASALATSIAYRFSSSRGLASAVGIMTLIILVFGEITPKTLAQRHTEWMAAHVAAPLYLLDVALRPVTWLLGGLTRVLDRKPSVQIPVTEEDILFMARLAHRHAQLAREARHVIESVLAFQQAVAREIMVPRTRVTTVDASWDTERVRATLTESVHSRFPVVQGSPDDIVGVLHAKHLLRLQPGDDWSTAVVPPLFIPEGRLLSDLLQDFRRSGQHLAIVLDEFGGFSGVVTLEDVLELLVGEIEDEFDQDREDAMVRLENGWLVPGHTPLRRLERALHRTLAHPEGVDSVGGLAASLLGDGLAEGATIRWEGLSLLVEEMEEGRATRVRVTLPTGKA
jgi:putative hemolysin